MAREWKILLFNVFHTLKVEYAKRKLLSGLSEVNLKFSSSCWCRRETLSTQLNILLNKILWKNSATLKLLTASYCVLMIVQRSYAAFLRRKKNHKKVQKTQVRVRLNRLSVKSFASKEILFPFLEKNIWIEKFLSKWISHEKSRICLTLQTSLSQSIVVSVDKICSYHSTLSTSKYFLVSEFISMEIFHRSLSSWDSQFYF